MTIDAATRLFFDASCLIAAAGSPQGGSGFLLDLCRRGWLRAAVSHVVLLEAERNIIAKRGTAALQRYHILLAQTPWRLASVPAAPDAAVWRTVVNPKDQHVVDAVLASAADYLITLDRSLIAEIGQAGLSFGVMEPGTFIKTLLPLHRALQPQE